MLSEKELSDRKLICDFMDVKPKSGYIKNMFQWSDGVFFSVNEFDYDKIMNAIINYVKYDSDWNWLMKVVEKIENCNDGCVLVIIEDERCHINNQNGFEIDSVGHTKIEAVYNACVEFIKWYNKNK